MIHLPEPEWVFPFNGMEVGESFFIPTLRFAEMIYAIDCGAKRAGGQGKVLHHCQGQTHWGAHMAHPLGFYPIPLHALNDGMLEHVLLDYV